MAGRALTPSDEELSRRFQETGDRECFAELFVRHRQKVYFACRRFFADVPTAEDATQVTFLRAYRNPGSFQGGGYSAWLMRIARNVCIDEWRKRQESPVVDMEVADLPAPIALDLTLEADRLAERVRQEMKSLVPAQRQCLELKIDGYSYEETAARTGFPVEAVKSHLQNGRRMLWKRLEGTLAPSK
jgi:RNA polymerase sigma-70 factor (ECF subfamily)